MKNSKLFLINFFFINSEPDNSDFKNVNRKPEDTLVLITKQKLGKDYVWMLPTKPWDEGETLREVEFSYFNYFDVVSILYFFVISYF